MHETFCAYLRIIRKRDNMKVKIFLTAILEAFTSTLGINNTNEPEELDFDVLNSKTIEQLEKESQESLNTIIEDFNMTIVVKHLFLVLAFLSASFGIHWLINRNWHAALGMLISLICYKLYDNRKRAGDAKHSFIQFTISNEVESERAKKIPGYQMREPGIYEDNLS